MRLEFPCAKVLFGLKIIFHYHWTFLSFHHSISLFHLLLDIFFTPSLPPPWQLIDFHCKTVVFNAWVSWIHLPSQQLWVIDVKWKGLWNLLIFSCHSFCYSNSFIHFLRNQLSVELTLNDFDNFVVYIFRLSFHLAVSWAIQLLIFFC